MLIAVKSSSASKHRRCCGVEGATIRLQGHEHVVLQLRPHVAGRCLREVVDLASCWISGIWVYSGHYELASFARRNFLRYFLTVSLLGGQASWAVGAIKEVRCLRCNHYSSNLALSGPSYFHDRLREEYLEEVGQADICRPSHCGSAPLQLHTPNAGHKTGTIEFHNHVLNAFESV